jgi:peptidoglycan/LPS O-acetylase OafA/YrhL
MEKHRIEGLDGFRFLAILSVMLYHFTNSWIGLYPYGNFFRHLFQYGWLGVYFFFMISGFVISYTLERTSGIHSFFTNRLSRLFPPMLLCTIITFVVSRTLDDQFLFPNAHQPKNFLPSLSFVSPALWSLPSKINFAWINGSYWSLWVEVQFYFIASAIYFLNKKDFFRNILLAGLALGSLKYIPIYFIHFQPGFLRDHGWNGFFTGWKRGDEIFNIDFFIFWFLSGIIFHHLYKGFSFRRRPFDGLCAVLVFTYLVAEILLFRQNSFFSILAGAAIMHLFFLLLLYGKQWLSWLANPFVRRVGVISYSTYLIHEVVGVLLIHKYGGWLGRLSFLSPLIAMILATVFAELSYRYYEKKSGTLIKKFFSR